MIKKMLLNATDPAELRVALVEDGRLEAYFAEVAAREQTRGNIYKALVVNVEPSLQAAFLDYGASRHGFLQVSDLRPDLWASREGAKGLPPVSEVLKRGQEVLVQVVKEETGTKGASLTTFLSLPGQFLVLTPGREGRGVSRKIASDGERSRLKQALAELELPAGVGIIARTAAEGRSKKDVQAEVKLLLRLWEDIQKRAKKGKGPALVHKEEELALRAVRDWFTSEVKEILVDDPETYARLEHFVGLVNPRRKKVVKLYRENRPIFSKHEVEDQLATIYQPVVKLPSGASVVISPTEALVAIDVNSGKAISGKEIEETALKVNLEAAQEIARQLRLRDLGGLIVIDFIDMRDRKARNQVVKKLKDEMKKDKARSAVGSISRFGLLEMSRQRIRPPADFGATQSCPHCLGRGLVRTPEAVGRTILRGLDRRLGSSGGGRYRLDLAPDAAHYILNAKRSDLTLLEERRGVTLEVHPDPGLGPQETRLEKLEQAAAPEPAADSSVMDLDLVPAKEPAPADAAPKKRSRRRRSGASRRRGRSRKPAATKSAEN